MVRWPYPTEAWLATDGGFDTMNLIVQTLLSPRDRVVIEDPTATRLLDMLDNIGEEILSLPCDAQGLLPAALAAQLQKSPAIFIYAAAYPLCHRPYHQPSTQLLTWHVCWPASTTLIMDDNGIGDLSCFPLWNLGSHFPRRVLHVHSLFQGLGRICVWKWFRYG